MMQFLTRSITQAAIRFAVRLAKDEQGQDLVEYALIVAAVGLALITTVNTVSQAIVNLYSNIVISIGLIGTQQ